MLDNIWKTHDSSPWKDNFINGIQIHNQSLWFKPMAIHSSKAQFSLATSKPNSYWQYQNPTSKAQFLLALLYQKEKRPRLSTLGIEKKYHVKMLLWQKRTMAIILWRNSLRAILRIMFSYYEPWNTWTSFCITTSIIYTFYTRGKTFKPTSSSFKLLETMNTAICNSS